MSKIGNKRLLRLANHLETLKPRQLKMRAWFSKQGDEFYVVDRSAGATVANVGKLTSECGFAACAVGHAAGLRSFREQGFRLVNGDDGVVSPRYTVPGTDRSLSDWKAVEQFFELNTHDADFLFNAECYGERVQPQTVANRIRQFVDRQ